MKAPKLITSMRAIIFVFANSENLGFSVQMRYHLSKMLSFAFILSTEI